MASDWIKAMQIFNQIWILSKKKKITEMCLHITTKKSQYGNDWWYI